MDGMQSHWWHLVGENDTMPEDTTTVSFSFNYARISAIAEISVAGFDSLLVTNDHGLYPAFTHCTWVDASGNTHNENFNTHDTSAFPVDVARNGITNLSGAIDITAMM